MIKLSLGIGMSSAFFFSKKNVYGYSQFDSRKSPFYSSNRKNKSSQWTKFGVCLAGILTF
jgi:hypothetical protein